MQVRESAGRRFDAPQTLALELLPECGMISEARAQGRQLTAEADVDPLRVSVSDDARQAAGSEALGCSLVPGKLQKSLQFAHFVDFAEPQRGVRASIPGRTKVRSA